MLEIPVILYFLTFGKNKIKIKTDNRKILKTATAHTESEAQEDR